MAVDMMARGLAGRAYKLASGSTTLKNNMTAASAPTVTDDEDTGYAIGSIWVYDNTTYTCVDSTVGEAVWQTSSDIIAFDTWEDLVAAISILSPSYIGKYALLANANGAPSANITYIYPNVLSDYIVDGGSATLKINNQGDNYSVTTMPRTISNPIITSIMTTAAAKPTTKGYYIFTVIPTNGLPSGCNTNDILYFNGSAWSTFQKYTSVSASIVVGSASISQVTWVKLKGSWKMLLNDNSSSSYIDVGGVRIQWGSTTSTTVTFPASFKDITYSFTGTVQSTGQDAYSVTLTGKSATAATVRKKYANGSTVGDIAAYSMNWVAIGLVP